MNLAAATKSWVPQIIAGGIVIACGALFVGMFMPSRSSRDTVDSNAALRLCQQTIHGLAEFGGADTPPYATNYGKGDEFYFAWPRGSFEFTNGYGAKLPMSASCIGSIRRFEIEHLTINAKTII